MFNLFKKHAFGRPILKCDDIGSSPPCLTTLYGENVQIFIDIPGEESAF